MVYILSGEDSSQASLQLKKIHFKEGLDVPLIRLDAKEDPFDQFEMEADAISLFEPRKILVIDHASFFTARNTTTWQPEEVIKRLDNDLVFVFITSGKVDRRRKINKELLKKAKVVDCDPLDYKTQPAFVREQIAAAHLQLDYPSTQYVLSHIGNDRLKIQSELQKLALFSPKPSLKDVEALLSVEPMDDIFKMTDALFERNAVRLLALYRHFRSLNMDALAIVAIVSGQVRFLYQVRVLMDQNKSRQEMMSLLSAKPYRIQVSSRQAARFSSYQLLEMLNLLAQLDQKMKLGQIDKDLGFEQFVMEMLEENQR